MYPSRGDGPAVAPLLHTAVPYQLRPDVYTSAFAKSSLFACTTFVSTLPNILCIFFNSFFNFFRIKRKKGCGWLWSRCSAVRHRLVAGRPARYRRLPQEFWYGICSASCVAVANETVFLSFRAIHLPRPFLRFKHNHPSLFASSYCTFPQILRVTPRIKSTSLGLFDGQEHQNC